MFKLLVNMSHMGRKPSPWRERLCENQESLLAFSMYKEGQRETQDKLFLFSFQIISILVSYKIFKKKIIV